MSPLTRIDLTSTSHQDQVSLVILDHVATKIYYDVSLFIVTEDVFSTQQKIARRWISHENVQAIVEKSQMDIS